MPREDATRMFLLASDRFYDTPDLAIASNDLYQHLAANLAGTSLVEIDGIWATVTHPDTPVPPHGWKVHVSLEPEFAYNGLDAVLDAHNDAPFDFKCLKDTRFVRMCVANWWPRSSAGKVITIYTRGPKDCRRLLEELEPKLDGMRGAYVLTDKRYRTSKCLYYRYGGFRKPKRVTAEGTRDHTIFGPYSQPWVDKRSPSYSLPPWVGQDLPAQDEYPSHGSLLLKRYQLTEALRHGTTGGVYRGEERTTGQAIVVKEARPSTGISENGLNAVARLHHEYETLVALRGLPGIPAPIDILADWENWYLVESYCPGRSLWEYLASTHPLIHAPLATERRTAFRAQVKAIIGQLQDLLREIHSLGFVYGDLSPDNVIINDDLHVSLIDFEACHRSGTMSAADIPFTPGFSAPTRSNDSLLDESADEFALTMLNAACVFPRNALNELSPVAFSRSLRRCASLLGVSPECHESSLSQRLLTSRSALEAANLSVPADAQDRLYDFICSTATPERRDRLYPSDPKLFETNGLCLAYGAAGVLATMVTCGFQPPNSHLAWLSGALKRGDLLPPGLWVGTAGIALAELMFGDSDGAMSLLRDSFQSRRKVGAHLATGAAGIGVGCLAAARRLESAEFADYATIIADELLAHGADDGRGLHWSSQGSPESVGLLRGSAGVASFFISLHELLGREADRQVAIRALEYDLSYALIDEAAVRFPATVQSNATEPYFEQGGAGVGIALTRYLKLRASEPLRRRLGLVCHGVAPVGMQTLNAGLWRGMAGVGMFAAAAAREGTPMAQESSEALAVSAWCLGSPERDGVAMPGDGLLRYSCDLATGSSGIMAFLSFLQGSEGWPSEAPYLFFGGPL